MLHRSRSAAARPHAGSPPSMAVTTPLPSLCRARMMQLPQPMRVTSSPSEIACRTARRSESQRDAAWHRVQLPRAACNWRGLTAGRSSGNRLRHSCGTARLGLYLAPALWPHPTPTHTTHLCVRLVNPQRAAAHLLLGASRRVLGMPRHLNKLGGSGAVGQCDRNPAEVSRARSLTGT